MEITTLEIVLAAALALSELLSLVPAIKANGVIQLVFGAIRYFAGLSKTKEVH